MQEIETYALILKNAFDPYAQAPSSVWETFVQHCQFATFQKDQIIKHQHSKETHFSFILQGSIGVFLWKENNFVCLDFAFENQFCVDYLSFLTNKPTALQIVALEKTQMLRMKLSDYQTITQNPQGLQLRLVAAENSFIDKQEQQIELLTKTAKERYEIICQKNPDIQNRLAQNHLASYLGITPQSLSRIRRKK